MQKLLKQHSQKPSLHENLDLVIGLSIHPTIKMRR